MAGPRPQQRDAEDTEHVYLRSLIRTTIPVIVVAYDDVQNLATVRLRRNPIDERGRAYEAPLLRDLPVAWPRGGGVIWRGSLLPGDLCLLLVSDRELAPQLLGPYGQPISGQTRRQHEVGDGIVVPLGLSTVGDTIAPGAGSLVVGREDGTATIKLGLTAPTAEIEAAQIKLGATATQSVAQAEALVAAVDAMLLGGIPAVGDGGAGLLSTMTIAWEAVKSTIAATKTKVE